MKARQSKSHKLPLAYHFLFRKAPVEEGIMIITESPQINKVRRIAAKLLIVNHEGDCLECSKIPEYKVSA